MKVFITILFFLIFSVMLISQQIENLSPQPRCAYVRQEFSAVFSLELIDKIVISDEVNQSLAERLIAELNTLGLTQNIVIKKLVDEPNPAQAIVLGIASNSVNLLINSLSGEQQVIVTQEYPGAEGYCMDILPMRCVINSSDEKGMFYAMMTLRQLIAGAQNEYLKACRIVDAPEFPVRWLYYPMNFLVGANSTKARNIWQTAYQNKLNGVLVADYKFDFNSAMPDRYSDSIVSVKKYAKDNYLDFVLACMPFGYSNSLLFNDPNLATGLTVYNQKFFIEGDTGRIIPATNVTLSNPGFENHNGDNFPGFVFIDAPGTYSFADNNVKHSGSTSIRFDNFDDNPDYKNARVTYRVKVKPFTQFHASAWVKSENIKYSYRFQIMAIGNKGRALCYQNLDLPATTDWKKYDVTFNSLDADTMTVYWGVWGPEQGKFWLDDLLLEETAFVNLIRREGAPLNVSHPFLDLVYREGADYDSVIDPKMGRLYGYGGDYDTWHQPPAFKVMKNGAIHNGDSLILSYYHMTTIYDGQVMATTADKKVYDIIRRELKRLDSLAKPEQFFMSHDEIRCLNWDAGESSKGMTPGQLLAENVNICHDIIREINPAAKIWIWSDMFDPYHNAKPNVTNYYLVNGDLSGSAELMTKDLGVANWNFSKATQSLKYFNDLGFDGITAPFYDQDQNAIRISKETSQGISKFKGMMYTTWAGNFDYLEHHGWYCWNHAPYIYHQPPYASPQPKSMMITFTIAGDKWDNGWSVDSVYICYRFSVNDPFLQEPVELKDGVYSFQIQLPSGSAASLLQYYISAVDNRKWRTKAPFGVDKYYEYMWTDVNENSPDVIFDYRNRTCTLNLHFNYVQETDLTVKCYDLLLRNIKAINVTDKNLKIDFSSEPNGIYFIEIYDNNKGKTLLHKFIKY